MPASQAIFSKVQKTSGISCYKFQKNDLLELNCAYAIMLREEHLISDSTYRQIKKGLLDSFPSVTEQDFEQAKSDIHFAYETALFKVLDPKVACQLHVGRSRNDMYFTLFRMSIRRALLEVMKNLIDLLHTIESHSKLHLETVIPYYTYGQPSQPGTWGHYLESVHEIFTSDLTLMKDIFEFVNTCPMGAAAGIGTSFHIDRERVCQLLGFNRVINNTIVAISDVNYFLRSIFSFVSINTTLVRMAKDLSLFSSSEFAILDCDPGICGGSSIMPQKKNAEALEALRSQALHLNGYFFNCLTASSSSLFPSYETYHFFEKFWDNVNVLIDNIKLMGCVLDNSEIRKDVAYDLALKGFTAATGMAESLTMESKEPFEITHHVVGGMIKKLMSENRLDTQFMTSGLMKEVSNEILGRAITKTDKEIRDMLDPLVSLKAKITGGTPKPEDTISMLKAEIQKTKDLEKWLEQVNNTLKESRERLLRKE